MSSFHLRNAMFVFCGLFGVSSGSYFSTRERFFHGYWRESARNVTLYAANNPNINANAVGKCAQITCRRVSQGE